MTRRYRAFLLSTTTDLPTRGFKLNRLSKNNELFASLKRWDKIVSNAKH